MRLVSILRISATILLGSILLVVLIYVFHTDFYAQFTSQAMGGRVIDMGENVIDTGEHGNVMTLFSQTIAPALLGCFTLLFVRRRADSSDWQMWGAISAVGTIVTVGGLLIMSNVYAWLLQFRYALVVPYTDSRIDALGYFWVLTFIREVPDVLLHLGIVVLVLLIVAWGFSWILPQQNPVILTAQQRRREELQMVGVAFIVIVGWYFLASALLSFPPLFLTILFPSGGSYFPFLSFYGAPFWYLILPFPLLVVLSLLPRNTNGATK